MADTPNESDPLVTRSVEPYVENGETSVHVHPQGASWRADDTNSAGHGVEGLTGEMDVSRGSTDMLGTSNSTRMAGISHGDGAGTYLDAGGAKRVIDATVGIGSHVDASNGHTDMPSIQTNTLTTANAPDVVSTPPRRNKPPDIPVSTAKRHPDEPNGCRNHADALNARTDVHSVGTDTKTTTNASETVRTSRNEPKTQNSPMETARWTPDAPNSCGSHVGGSSIRRDAHSIGNNTETPAKEVEHVRMRQYSSRTRNSPNGREIVMPKRILR